MNAQTMEGLVGANTNVNLIDTPMRVYKDARRRGDTATMERAMGYVVEFEDRAEAYKTKADEGMEEDAREAREKAELEREEVIQKRKEEQEGFEEKIAESKDEDTSADILEISEEGKELVKDNIELNNMSLDEIKNEVVKEPITYTKVGSVIHSEPRVGISISV